MTDAPAGASNDGNERFPSSTLLPFFLFVPLLKPNNRKKGTLIMKGLLATGEPSLTERHRASVLETSPRSCVYQLVYGPLSCAFRVYSRV